MSMFVFVLAVIGIAIGFIVVLSRSAGRAKPGDDRGDAPTPWIAASSGWDDRADGDPSPRGDSSSDGGGDGGGGGGGD